ncbi:hypothetical protein [Haloferula sp. A504]|uniref:hypothetical protein n=1 Tax=Haloferula sp. A504 TaxID=3373601 RepID=UPI0031C81637|nr:hypothetical protein [Verrucomicrobiaceae bacterium E54]
MVDEVLRRTPPDDDPLLSSRRPENRQLPLAGSAFHRAWIARVHGHEEAWMGEWETFLTRWLDRASSTD